MGVVTAQYDVFLIDTQPCLVISPDEMNNHISTVIVAPMTTKSHLSPSRVEVDFGGKSGWVVLDQIRTVDRVRLIKKLGRIGEVEILKLKATLKEMLVD